MEDDPLDYKTGMADLNIGAPSKIESYSFARGSTGSSFDHTLDEQIACKDYIKAGIERTRSRMNYVHRKPGSFFSQLRCAVPTGFEPAILALTGPHVRPLHHGTLLPNKRAVVYHAQ
jgi:hypothetical protein